MGKLYRLAAANIRRNKGQSFSFLVIGILSSLMLYLGIVIMLDYTANFDHMSQNYQAPDVVFLAQGDLEENIEDYAKQLRLDERTKQVEVSQVILTQGTFEYGGGEQSRYALFKNLAVEPQMGKWSIVRETQETVENPIYLPWLFAVGGNYQLEDAFQISVYTDKSAKTALTFTVAGFYEDTYFSTINNTTTGFLLPQEEYNQLLEQFGKSVVAVQFSVEVSDPADAESFVTKYGPSLSEAMGVGGIADFGHYEVLKSARTLTSSIGSFVIIGFSMLILVISLVVESFRIRNSIDEEMQNIGALKAIGYTGKQIACSFLMQFAILSLAGIIAGIAAACALLPLLSQMFAAQTGILWSPGFSFYCALWTLMGVMLPVLTVSWLSARRADCLPPIVALRFGVTNHNFRSNPFPLEKGAGPLCVSLAGKQFLQDVRHNLLIGLIILGITFAALFSGVLYYNINIEKEMFLKIVVGEMTDLYLECKDTDAAKEVLQKVRSNPEVEKAFYWKVSMLTFEKEYEAYCYILDEYELLSNEDWNYKGRFPKYDNEISLGGLMAKQIGKNIGDTITLSVGEESATYLITGLIQGSNYLGHDLCITKEGYKRIVEGYEPCGINVYVTEGTQVGDFINRMEKELPDISYISNEEEKIEGSMQIYQTIIGILAAVIMVITMLIVGLVLYLVIKTLLIRQRQVLAIQKAIGFTTIQLAWKNTLAFLPVLVLSSAAGCVTAVLGVNPFLSILFSSIGMMQVNFRLPVGLLVGIFGMVTGLGLIIVFLVSMKIRNISPYWLLSE